MKYVVVTIFLFLASFSAAQDRVVVSLTDFSDRNFAYRIFKVSHDVEIFIKAVGASDRRHDYRMAAKAWILRSRDRSLVWDMTSKNSRIRSRYIVESEEKIKLTPGCYELYYAVSPRLDSGLRAGDVGDLIIGLLRGSDSRDRIRNICKKWGVELFVKQGEVGSITSVKKGSYNRPVIRLSPMGDNECCSEGFSINQTARFRIYGIGEGSKRNMDDYAWLVDETRGKVVWKMDYQITKHGGGSKKNRKADKIITLNAGSFKVYYVTDESHSFEEWNEMPPYDPYFYGITLWLEDGDTTKISPYIDKLKERNLVDLTKIGRNRFEKVEFVLKRSLNLRILALGEYSGRSFTDYGWMIDKNTRKVVWRMTRSNTTHAGGARKNRMFYGTKQFNAGTYEVMYISDDSHSFNKWNEPPPFDPYAWGVSVWVDEDSFNQDWIIRNVVYADTMVLVNITEVENSEHRTASFTLNSKQKVRIYSVGEATGSDEMYDYGWIEDQHGNVVWKAEYRHTRPGGGSIKNVVIDTTINLKPGTYTVHYKTDGSHSFGHWNDDPPNDPEYWGIGVWKCIK